MTATTRQALQSALEPHGLRVRGGWIPDATDALPELPGGDRAVVVWMVGVAGSDFWPHFKASTFYQDGQPDPLDRWSAAIGSTLATCWGGSALFPFEGPPYHPFQRWADRSEDTRPSPLMLRMHPRFGLWHAYRFALAMPELDREDAKALQQESSDRLAASTMPSLCAQCSGQPCLSACPVNAFTGTRYRVDACTDHLHAQPQGACMQQGCLSRNACPQGSGHRYTPEHAVFHMLAFAKNH